MKKSFLRIASGLLAVVMIFALVGCKKSEGGDSGSGATTPEGKKVLRFLSNIQDREHTEGLIEQMQLDKWLEKNPDFEFDYEFVPNANIGEKTSQYMATDNLPDVYKEWGGTVDFDNKIKKGMLAPIWDSPKQANEEGYDYPDGALTKWQLSDGSDDKVYAGVVNFDFFVWFYNGELFAKEGWSEPESWQDLLDLLDDMTAKGYVPMSMSGKDPYGAYIIDELIMRVTGEIGVAEKIIEGEGNFADNADVRKAFEYAKQLVDHNVNGGTDWLAQDYAGCRGLFVNGQIPMMYFGSWEYMMIADDQLPESFRDNVDFFLTPEVPDGKGARTMLEGYYGCGFAVASKSKYLEDAVGLIKFYFEKENYCKDAWEMKVFIPAQNFSEFSSDKDARLQKKILQVMEEKTSTLPRGVKLRGYSNTWNSLTDPLWYDFYAGALSVDEILTQLDGYAQQARADAENMANS